MIDKKLLNQALALIAQKRTELAALDYNDEEYDDIEDELHDLEDSFNEEYGDFLEDVLMDVHDDLCPDSDVLLPTAYLAKKYVSVVKQAGDDVLEEYELGSEDGVYVDVDDYIDSNTRLLIVPNPARIVFMLNGLPKEILWSLSED